jgi:hypothetical protein
LIDFAFEWEECKIQKSRVKEKNRTEDKEVDGVFRRKLDNEDCTIQLSG